MVGIIWVTITYFSIVGPVSGIAKKSVLKDRVLQFKIISAITIMTIVNLEFNREILLVFIERRPYSFMWQAISNLFCFFSTNFQSGQGGPVSCYLLCP